jgi:hypothetical protein
MFSKLEGTDIFFNVTYSTFGFYEAELMAIGGYRRGVVTMILIRHVPTGLDEVRDGIAQIMVDGQIKVGDYDDNLYLTDECWDTFDDLDEGDKFRLGGETWTKMHLSEVRNVVGGKNFKAM